MRKSFTLKRYANSGFTLIEIMVAIGLMALIFGAGMASFQHTSQVQSMEGAADKIRQAMLVARSNALNGKKDCVICDCTPGGIEPLIGWTVSVDAATNRLSYQGLCATKPFGSHGEIMPAAVTITGGSVTFNALGGVSGPVAITVSGGGISKTVSVNANGEVEVSL